VLYVKSYISQNTPSASYLSVRVSTDFRIFTHTHSLLTLIVFPTWRHGFMLSSSVQWRHRISRIVCSLSFQRLTHNHANNWKEKRRKDFPRHVSAIIVMSRCKRISFKANYGQSLRSHKENFTVRSSTNGPTACLPTWQHYLISLCVFYNMETLFSLLIGD